MAFGSRVPGCEVQFRRFGVMGFPARAGFGVQGLQLRLGFRV